MASFLLAFATVARLVSAQSASCSLVPSGGIRPSIASGYEYQVVATGLSKPRGLKFDQAGHLLVIEQGTGALTALTLTEQNGCVSVGSSATVSNGQSLNHGIELSNDGETLYASSSESVFSWDYDSTSKAASNMQTLVTNMAGTDHTTRTLLLSQKKPGLLVVTRGSTSNIDFQATDITSGHSQIKAFDLHNRTGGSPYDFDPDGLRLGWGLRNEVGIAEHPVSGGLYSVENSADQITRMGVDVHENNPGEEMNFLGYLNGQQSANQGKNFGYPWCFAAWGVDELPDNADLHVGSQFAIDPSTDSNNQNQTDAFCAQQVAPRLTFQAHMAPIDIKFHNNGNEAWVSFHGSWDRTDPVGYKVSRVAFKNGEPTDGPTSTTAAVDIFMNADNSICPDNCFRPAGLVFDSRGRLFVASDASGEIYMITQQGTSTSSSSSPIVASSTASSVSSTSASSKSSAASSATSVSSASSAPSPSSTVSASASASSAATTGAASSWRTACDNSGTLLSSLLLLLLLLV